MRIPGPAIRSLVCPEHVPNQTLVTLGAIAALVATLAGAATARASNVNVTASAYNAGANIYYGQFIINDPFSLTENDNTFYQDTNEDGVADSTVSASNGIVQHDFTDYNHYLLTIDTGSVTPTYQYAQYSNVSTPFDWSLAYYDNSGGLTPSSNLTGHEVTSIMFGTMSYGTGETLLHVAGQIEWFVNGVTANVNSPAANPGGAKIVDFDTLAFTTGSSPGTYNLTALPEPASASVLLLGGILTLTRARGRAKRRQSC